MNKIVFFLKIFYHSLKNALKFATPRTRNAGPFELWNPSRSWLLLFLRGRVAQWWPFAQRYHSPVAVREFSSQQASRPFLRFFLPSLQKSDDVSQVLTFNNLHRTSDIQQDWKRRTTRTTERLQIFKKHRKIINLESFKSSQSDKISYIRREKKMENLSPSQSL